MTEALHRDILSAWEKYDWNSQAELAREVEMPGRTMRNWLSREVGEAHYRPHRDDDLYQANVDQILGRETEEGEEERILAETYDDWPKPPPAPTVSGVGPEDEIDVGRVRTQAERMYERKQRKRRDKKQQSIRFKTGPVCLFFVGDQHIGNDGTDVGRMYDEAQIIQQTPGAYAFLTGDVVDNFIVGLLKDQNWKPSLAIREQWALAKDYVQQFGDRLLGKVGGNHGAWSRLTTGIDRVADVVPEGVLYDTDEMELTVHVGPARYETIIRHRWPYSSQWNISHALDKAAKATRKGFDIYVGAHDHRGAIVREGITDGRRYLAVKNGTYKTEGDYGRRMGFERHDSSTGAAVILHDDGTYHGTGQMDAALRYMREVYS